MLAEHGAKIDTMSRRLSAIKFAHRIRNHPDPTMPAWSWCGRNPRRHGAPPEQATALLPRVLFDVLGSCPTAKMWKTPRRAPEPNLAGLRDRVLLLVGFVGGLRRSELAGIDVEHLVEHPRGMVPSIPRSKTNQHRSTPPTSSCCPWLAGPSGARSRRSGAWRKAASITDGALLRPVSKGNHARERRLSPAAVNTLVQAAVARAGIDPDSEHDYSAHSQRAGFITYAHLRGPPDRAVAHQTRHRSLSSLTGYIRVHDAWVDNAATELNL